MSDHRERCREIESLLDLVQEQLRLAIHETGESQLTKNIRQAAVALTHSQAWADDECMSNVGAGCPS